ncbi:alpha/beta fold hydrolase [Vannielia litorea]|uniref:alpha/beta fold hydrolase n=1 Tax=Vannielia litorea TaxID=1217970 RepID=UPI001BCE2C8B|nr:alpha/beta fold hydrolase [Vannielia litorea]MBS8227599.1 alpha/beta fold hydrolase [Vannielia litorea]
MSATPLVLLPGMMCDARLFAPQIAAFGQAREVIVPDLTGACTMRALAAAVLSEAPERFALGGLSMGGIVAMEVARQAPERLAGLALLDTNPLAELPEKQAGRAPQIERVHINGLAAVMTEEMIPHYLADEAATPDLPDLCLRMALDLGQSAFTNQSIALRDRPDQTGTLKALSMPSLVLCGRHDRLCPVERHELMHALIPGSTLEIVENAGHLTTLERPNETNAALARWLETL